MKGKAAGAFCLLAEVQMEAGDTAAARAALRDAASACADPGGAEERWRVPLLLLRVRWAEERDAPSGGAAAAEAVAEAWRAAAELGASPRPSERIESMRLLGLVLRAAGREAEGRAVLAEAAARAADLGYGLLERRLRGDPRP